MMSSAVCVCVCVCYDVFCHACFAVGAVVLATCLFSYNTPYTCTD